MGHSDADGRLEEAVAEYLRAVDAGTPPETEEFLARYPDLEGPLREFLDEGEFIAQEVGQLRSKLTARSEGDTGPHQPPTPEMPDIPGLEMLEPIDSGGMGAVYRARHLGLGRDVAVKVMLAKLQERVSDSDSEPLAVKRFRNEARIHAQLQHPGVAPLFEQGELGDGRLYFTMKYIKGRTLADLLDERESISESWPRFVPIFEQICQTVSYAHAHSVIHRDLKPLNVMVGAFGEVQVMDWGIGKVLADAGETGHPETEPGTVITVPSEEGDRTGAGSILGTWPYMSPEQACGLIDRLDSRSDVFGLGAILCAILTGDPPYRGTEDLVKRVQDADLDDAFGRLDECGADPDLIVLSKRCLSPRQDDRPANAGEVATEVARYQAEVQQRLEQERLDRVRAEEQRKREQFEAEQERERLTLLAREEQERLRLRALHERKQRRLAVGLAVSVLALVCLGSAGGLFLQDQIDDRRREQALSEQQQRQDVEALLKESATRLQADQFRAAWASLRQAADRLGESGPADLRHRLDRHRRDLRFAEELDRIRMALADWAEGGKHRESCLQEYSRVFAEAGFGVEQADPTELAGRIRRSPMAERVVAALDHWANVADVEGEDAARDRALQLARLADPDPILGDLLRMPAVWNGDAVLRQRLRRAAMDLDPSKVSSSLVVALGTRLSVEEADSLWERSSSAQPADFWLHFEWGSQLLEQGGYSKAVGAFRAALAARPGDFRTHSNLGVALMGEGNADAAIEEFRRAINIDDGFSAVWVNMGVALRAEGDLDGAIQSFRRAIAIDPEDSSAHYNLGLALQFEGDLDGAIVEFRRAIFIYPEYPRVHNDLGNVLKAKADLAGAIEQYRLAVAIDPEDASAHHNLGLALQTEGDLDRALMSYHIALCIDPNDAVAYNNLGNVLKAKGDLAGAIEQYRQAIDVDNHYALAHNNLGVALTAEGNMDGAIMAFRSAIAVESDYALAHNNLGLALYYKGKLDLAIQAYRRAIAIDPDDALAHNHLGLALQGVGDLNGAVESFHIALCIDPDEAKAHYNLGNALYSKRDLVGAINAYRRAIVIDPDFAAAHSNLGTALYSDGDLDGGIEHYRHAVAIDPDSVVALSNLGAALTAKGEFVGAIEACRRVVALDPNYAEAHCDLGHNLRRLGEFEAALASLERGHELGSKRPNWRHPSDRWVNQCRELVELDSKLTRILSGEVEADDASEMIALAELCLRYKRRSLDAVRFYAHAFEEEPKLATNPLSGNRYNAACAASLGSSSVPTFDSVASASRASLRQQALGWLAADLAAWKLIAEGSGAQANPTIRKTMHRWRQAPDLDAVRDAIDELPEPERQQWRNLWAEVDALLAKVSESP